MGQLRDRMCEDLVLRGCEPNTINTYLGCIRWFAAFFMRSPAEMGATEIRTFALHLLNVRKLAASSVGVYVGALVFLYRITLGPPEEVAALPPPKVPKLVPVILSGSEVERLLGAIRSLKHRAMAMLAPKTRSVMAAIIGMAAAGVIGSPMFMSPEQAKASRTIDHRSDLWSLGASLYCALTGAEPWAGRETMGEILVGILTEMVPHTQDRAPWAPAGLAEIVHKALERDPAKRYASAEELAQALMPFTGNKLSVYAADVQPLSELVRSQQAPRASLPTAVLPASPAGGALSATRHIR